MVGGAGTWGQRVCEEVETSFDDIDSVIADLGATQTQLAAAVLRLNIGLSYTSPSLIVTAADVGTDVTITIASHTRIYADGTQVSVTGGTLTAKAFTTDYGVYYDDATLAVTAPTFVATTTLAQAQNNFAAGRHFVGTVKTPADGAASTSGGTTPPGSGGGTASGGTYTGGSGGGGCIP